MLRTVNVGRKPLRRQSPSHHIVPCSRFDKPSHLFNALVLHGVVMLALELISVLFNNQLVVADWRGNDWRQYRATMFSMLDKMFDRWKEQLSLECQALLKLKTKYFHHRIFGQMSRELIDLTEVGDEAMPLQGNIKGVANPVFKCAIKNIVAAVRKGHEQPKTERKRFERLLSKLLRWKKEAEQLVRHTEYDHSHSRLLTAHSTAVV
jgi:hypothetical protein